MVKKILLTTALSYALAVTPVFAQEGAPGQTDNQAGTRQEITGEDAQVYLDTAAVRLLQKRLQEEGYDAGMVDGIWGKSTAAAAQRYQQANNLEPTATPTIALINSIGLGGALLRGQGQPGDTPQAAEAAQGEGVPIYVGTAGVRQVQEALNEQGYSVGQADGLWGPNTAEGAARFQSANNLEPSGKLDVSLINALGVGQDVFTAGLAGTQGHVEWTEGDAASRGTRLWLGPGAIRQVEQALQESGFSVGTVDGNWDDRAGQAAQEYQQAQGLEPTGSLTTQLLVSVGMGNWLSAEGESLQASQASPDSDRQNHSAAPAQVSQAMDQQARSPEQSAEHGPRQPEATTRKSENAQTDQTSASVAPTQPAPPTPPSADAQLDPVPEQQSQSARMPRSERAAETAQRAETNPQVQAAPDAGEQTEAKQRAAAEAAGVDDQVAPGTQASNQTQDATDQRPDQPQRQSGSTSAQQEIPNQQGVDDQPLRGGVDAFAAQEQPSSQARQSSPLQPGQQSHAPVTPFAQQLQQDPQSQLPLPADTQQFDQQRIQVPVQSQSVLPGTRSGLPQPAQQQWSRPAPLLQFSQPPAHQPPFARRADPQMPMAPTFPSQQQVLDWNRDGVISNDELSAYGSTAAGQDRGHELMELFDTDRDGYVDFEELHRGRQMHRGVR